MFVSALNVRYRDVQHLIGLAVLVWFWMTPIVYSAGAVYQFMIDSRVHIAGWRLSLVKPVSWVVMWVQRPLYHSSDASSVLAPYSATQLAGGLSVVIAISAVAVYLSWRLYFSLSGDFAEEL